MKRDWTETIKDKLSESSVTPPDDLWASVSSELDKVAAPGRMHKMTIRRWLAVAAILTALVGGYVYLASRVEPSLTDGNVVAEITDLPTDNSVTPDPDLSIANEMVASDLNSNGMLATAGKKSFSPTRPSERVELQTPGNTIPETARPGRETDTTARSGEEVWPETDESLSDELVVNQELPFEIPAKQTSKRMSFSFFASNGNIVRSSSESMDYVYGGDHHFAGSPELKVKDFHHKQPIRFGMSMRFPLAHNLSIGAGLTYTRLSSELSWSNGMDTEQTLHYLGIPVSVDYSLPSWRRFSFYLTAGAMIEKCVAGQNMVPSKIKPESICERPVQFSAFAGAGVQFDFSRHVALYAEPLATYYFNNHSDVVNIYKDRPLSFDLRVGLRFTFGK